MGTLEEAPSSPRSEGACRPGLEKEIETKDKDRIGIGSIRIEIRRERNYTCSNWRVTHNTRVTAGRGGDPVPVQGEASIIVGVQEQRSGWEARNTLRGLRPRLRRQRVLERRLGGSLSLILARLLTRNKQV